MNRLISIVIPVYNASEYLERCVNSILAQTYATKEIILVNDGSQDDSGVLCDSLSERHENVTVLHQKNMGQANARNNGVRIAKGEYITFVDSDDYIKDPNTYSHAIGAFDNDVDVVQYPYKTYHSDASKNTLYSITKTCVECGITPDSDGSVTISAKRDMACLCRASNHWDSGCITTSVWDKVFRKNIIARIKQRPMFLEDVVATIDVLDVINAIKIIPTGEYAYCIRDNSTLTSKWTLKKSVDELESILHVYEFLLDNAYESKQTAVTFFWIVSMLTNIRKLYGMNYLNTHKEVCIPSPPITIIRYTTYCA